MPSASFAGALKAGLGGGVPREMVWGEYRGRSLRPQANRVQIFEEVHFCALSHFVSDIFQVK